MFCCKSNKKTQIAIIYPFFSKDEKKIEKMTLYLNLKKIVFIQFINELNLWEKNLKFNIKFDAKQKPHVIPLNLTLVSRDGRWNWRIGGG